MAIRLAVFDMAGTTVYDRGFVTEALMLAMKESGFPVAFEEVNPLMGYRKPLAIELLLKLHWPEDAENGLLIQQIHDKFLAHMLDFYRHSTEVLPLPGVEETFAALRRHDITIGLDTGFSADIANTIVDRLGWREKGWVQYVVASDEVPEGRPAPYMINKMMEAEGITNPLEVAKIGDTEVDIREGQQAGCRYSIALTTGAFKRHELEPYQPDLIADDIRQVIPLLTRRD